MVCYKPVIVACNNKKSTRAYYGKGGRSMS